MLGNEIDDLEAESFAKMQPTVHTQKTQTLASHKRKIRRLRDSEWKKEWEAGGNSGALKNHSELCLKPTK